MSSTEMQKSSCASAKCTAGEAGWHISRYNLSAPVPGSEAVAIANLFKGTCAEYSPLELYLLSILDRLDEHHPIIERFAKRGIITRIDERAALDMMGREACAGPHGISLTICPTMNCNFDCPYCFENHRPGRMSAEVQDDVVSLTRRMLKACGGRHLSVTWFGGEPLLAIDVIEALSLRLITLAQEFSAEYSAGIITNGYLLTQKNIDILERSSVSSCQVTVDGLGGQHDATRHLAGGGATFDRIIRNLRDGRIPFRVSIRQNVQESNLAEVPKVREFMEKLAEESGNKLDYAPAPVYGNKAADERGSRSVLLCGKDSTDICILQEAGRFTAGRGHFCGANVLWSVGIDENGNLFKCWESAAEPAHAFATARDWDPEKPLETSFAPDNLTMYLNTALPVTDEECRDCVWLPLCVGGCPHRRLFYGKNCVAFRNHPESYVLALHARIGKNPPKEKS
ncbi:MAG: SPASM domain-containing protein [Oscillospiraceae bacterium]|nr:SPASM domain-containing protein [Oscillospiraceae bacterium]